MNVEDQLRAVIARQADRYEVPLPDIDGFAAGAMRRRRRNRMAAALAACAVLGTVASGFVAGRGMWDTTGAGPADQPTSPTQESTTSSSTDARVGFVGPPPPGTPPTGPATGELVAAAALYNSGTFVYADGRIINAWKNFGASDQFRGFMVRQLTPSGVEAMRSFLVEGTSGLIPVSEQEAGELGVNVRHGGRLMHVRNFKGCENGQGTSTSTAQATWVGCPGITDPNWLPASAWQDPVFRPFVPHSYQVCLFADPRSSPADVLPAEAVALLLGPGSPLADSPVRQEVLCRVVASPLAKEMADIMDRTAPAYVRQEGDLDLSYGLPSRWTTAEGVAEGWLSLLPVLPHGGTYGPGG